MYSVQLDALPIFAYRDQGCVHIKINAMYKPGPLQCTKLLITLAATFVQ